MIDPKRPRGRLIAFEGIDGSGKTTLAKRFARALRHDGFSVALVREPSDRILGRYAVNLAGSDPWGSGIYFTLDRFRARPILERALASHDVVLSDRTFYSTLAYQGSALPAVRYRRLEKLQHQIAVRPHRIVLLDLPPSIAWSRLTKRRGDRTALERRKTLSRVARAYERLSQRPGWIVIDARPSTGAVQAEIERRILPWLRRSLGRTTQRS